MGNTPQQQPDPADQRQRDILDKVSRILRDALPRPLADTPEARAHRDRAALAEAVSLAPGNLVEAGLAAHGVAAAAHAADRLRLAAQHAADPKCAGRLRAQAASMGREARSHHALLLKAQAVRRKRDADPAARERDAQTEQSIRRQMTEALESIQAKAAPPAAAPEPARHGPSRQPGRPLNLGLWQAHLHAGSPKPVDRTVH